MQKGDVPVLKSLADQYSMSDNFHQSFPGGTAANHVVLGSGGAVFWSDGQGNATRQAPKGLPSSFAQHDAFAFS